LEKQNQDYLKEIELSKFHEERGKIKCKCHSCEEQKKIQADIKAEREKLIDDYEQKQKNSGENKVEIVKADCGECFEYKKVDPETGLCKKCVRNYN
jgi:hypothetical protein